MGVSATPALTCATPGKLTAKVCQHPGVASICGESYRETTPEDPISSYPRYAEFVGSGDDPRIHQSIHYKGEYKPTHVLPAKLSEETAKDEKVRLKKIDARLKGMKMAAKELAEARAKKTHMSERKREAQEA